MKWNRVWFVVSIVLLAILMVSFVNTTERVSLRDYIAIEAMNGLLSRSWDRSASGVAQEAYRYADAMMEAR